MKQVIRSILSLLILTLCSLLLLNCITSAHARRDKSSRVAGGTPLEQDHEFPHLVSLQYGRNGGAPQHFCGASVISKRWLLTAGHCLSVEGMDNTKIRVLAGVAHRDVNCQDPSSNCILRSVSRTIVHPNYNSQYLRNDLALIELSSDLPLGDASQNRVQAIAIEGGSIPWQTLVVLAGWGRTKDSSNDIPSRAQKAYLPLQSPNSCNQKGLGMASPYQICAGEGRGINSCQGDSGGPLFWKRQSSDAAASVGSMGLVGLVSYGPQGCGTQGSFGVYTNATYWINYLKTYVSDLKVENYMASPTPTPTPTNPTNPPGCTCVSQEGAQGVEGATTTATENGMFDSNIVSATNNISRENKEEKASPDIPPTAQTTTAAATTTVNSKQ